MFYFMLVTCGNVPTLKSEPNTHPVKLTNMPPATNNLREEIGMQINLTGKIVRSQMMWQVTWCGWRSADYQIEWIQ